MNLEIKFIVPGACSAIGGFAPGDVARIDATLAKHFVDEVKCAVYTNTAAHDEPEKSQVKSVKKAK